MLMLLVLCSFRKENLYDEKKEIYPK